jgi:MFS family permease
VLAFASNVATVVLGAALWGLHMGLTQGILASLVADTAPADLRGTAFGLFSLVAGIATVAASVIAGALWDAVGPQVTFLAGATFAALALAVVPLLRRSVAGST